MDVLTKTARSRVMSRVRGSGNKGTELALIRVFRKQHITGWRRQQCVFGKPDFVFREMRVAVFVDGCFWHRCPFHARDPKSNKRFWEKKLTTNKARDRLVNRTLRTHGWKVVRIWEHELARKNERRLLMRLRRLLVG